MRESGERSEVSTPAGRVRRLGAGGFTFIEIMLVIGILGVLFTVGAISFRGLMPKYYVKSSARRLGTWIEHVRLTAVSRNQWMGIRYVLTPQGDETPYYEIIPAAPPEFPDQPIEDRTFVQKEPLSPGVRFAKIILSDSRAVDSGAVNVLFSPMGNSGSHIVVLEGEAGRLMSVKVNGITGAIGFLENAEASFQNFQE
jgi:prepilin-type N-terminal cleavage/methylation domain-containing protein